MKVEILGIRTDAQPFQHAVDTLLAWAQGAGQHYVCPCPVYTLMLGRDMPALNVALNHADMVTADGMPVVWMQRYLGAEDAERVCGPDLVLALCEQGVPLGVKHYFWGGQPEVTAKLVENLRARFPGVQVSGYYAPPIAPLEAEALPSTVEALNSSDADIIWVGLGSPKQDLWAALYRPVLKAPLIIGVGAAFDFHAGAKKQAPRWMQRSGLEWLFRLHQEPRRLWRRYILYNLRFVWDVLRLHLLRR